MAEFNVGDLWSYDRFGVRITGLSPIGEIKYEFLLGEGCKTEDSCTPNELRAWIFQHNAQRTAKQTCTKRRLAHG